MGAGGRDSTDQSLLMPLPNSRAALLAHPPSTLLAYRPSVPDVHVLLLLPPMADQRISLPSSLVLISLHTPAAALGEPYFALSVNFSTPSCSPLLYPTFYFTPVPSALPAFFPPPAILTLVPLFQKLTCA